MRRITLAYFTNNGQLSPGIVVTRPIYLRYADIRSILAEIGAQKAAFWAPFQQLIGVCPKNSGYKSKGSLVENGTYFLEGAERSKIEAFVDSHQLC